MQHYAKPLALDVTGGLPFSVVEMLNANVTNNSSV